MISIEYLDDERKKTWAKLLELENEIGRKVSADEQEAKQASKKSAEYRNKCQAVKDEATTILEEIKRLHQLSKDSSDSTAHLAKEASDTKLRIDEIQVFYDDLAQRKDEIGSQIAELEAIFLNHATFSEKIKKLDGIYTTSDSYSSKIDATYNQLVARKKELDQLYYEIIGYKNKDPETGVETEVAGLKKELQNSYDELKSGFTEFSKNKKEEVNTAIKEWNDEYSSVLKQIQDLLPHALTTGLSYAYSEKKKDEVNESAALDKVFRKSIWGLVAVSLIPFAVSVYQLLTNVALDTAILQLPRLVLSILPLYIPILWVAYSSNRKMNLSKRLIEEYTHKEVLSKTFEGLAQQISDIRDTEVSLDLKTRLLYNILEVSSENPGKLISDYNKSDHPLMDALEKSVKLANAVEKLAKIPGMSKLTSVLDKKSKELLERESEKAAAGIEKVS